MTTQGGNTEKFRLDESSCNTKDFLNFAKSRNSSVDVGERNQTTKPSGVSFISGQRRNHPQTLILYDRNVVNTWDCCCSVAVLFLTLLVCGNAYLQLFPLLLPCSSSLEWWPVWSSSWIQFFLFEDLIDFFSKNLLFSVFISISVNIENKKKSHAICGAVFFVVQLAQTNFLLGKNCGLGLWVKSNKR